MIQAVKLKAPLLNYWNNQAPGLANFLSNLKKALTPFLPVITNLRKGIPTKTETFMEVLLPNQLIKYLKALITNKQI